MNEVLKLYDESTNTGVDVEAVRDRLKNFLIKSDKKQSIIARSLGVSETALSQFLSGKYLGNVMNLAEKAEQFLSLEYERLEKPKLPNFAFTSTAREIYSAVKYAHVNNDISMICGEAGRGKTMALEQYTTENKGVVYVQADSTITSSKAILEEILDALGKKMTGSERLLKKAIIDALRDSGRVIIVDEAQHLNLKAFHALRALNDKGHIGLVLAGNQSVYDRMHGRGEDHFAQLSSRVGMKKLIPRYICKEDIEEIFKSKCLDQDSITYLHNLANDTKEKGGLRYMMKVYMLAANVAHAQGTNINIGHLELAHKMQSGEA